MSDQSIKAILFDCDGVVMNSEPVYDELFRHWLRDNNLTVDDLFYSKVRGAGWVQLFAQVNTELNTTFDPAVEAHTMADRIEEYIMHTGIPLMEGAKSAITTLAQQYILAMISSSERRVVERMLRHHGIYELFQHITSIEDVQHPKPHPQPYAMTMAVLGVQPEEAIAIEDSVNGVKSAAIAGAFVYALPDPATPASAYGELAKVVYSFDEILADL